MAKVFSRSATNWSPRRARRRLVVGLAIFAIGLVVPLSLLVIHTFNQLEVEAFYALRDESEDLARSIDQRFAEIIEREENRSFDEYSFLNLAGNTKTNFVQLSPLSSLDSTEKPPGAIGYFQLSPEGDFSSPLLPSQVTSITDVSEYGIDKEEFRERRGVEMQVLGILKQNRIASTVTSNGRNFGMANIENFSQQYLPSKKSAYTQKSFKVVPKYKAPPITKSLTRDAKNSKVWQSRKEKVALPGTSDAGQQAVSVETFESEIDPFQFSILPSGHAVFFRKVWKEGKRYIQGVVIDVGGFFSQLIRTPYENSSLSVNTAVTIRYDDVDLARFDPVNALPGSSFAASIESILVTQNAMSAPFHKLEMLFSIDQIILPSSAIYLEATTIILVLVIIFGLLAIFAAGRRQIALAEQQRDFVSAVSHELKTPITSIRMYGEMLKEGWASEEKRKTYYDFIFSESERLSRLVNNVLQLSRLSRGQDPELKMIPGHEAFATVQSIVHSQAAGADYELVAEEPETPCARKLYIDIDNLTQVIVNLVDNAIKFSKDCEPKRVDIGYRDEHDRMVIWVRDYGPGIPEKQLAKVFNLFFRAENEMTRTTKGTGIGLALVQELVQRMDGTIDVFSEPGKTVFTITLPLHS